MNTKTTTSSTNMYINCMDDLVRQAEIRPISREELTDWNPIIVMNSVNYVTGALEGIGHAVDTIEDAFKLLESGELIRLAKEREKIEEEMLNSLCEW